MKGDHVDDTQKITLFLNPKLHAHMKEYAKRKRIHIGLAYDQAVQLFLTKTDQYMGKARESQLKGVKING
jgi:hypothetical protein